MRNLRTKWLSFYAEHIEQRTGYRSVRQFSVIA
jgi:hypothetical protein